MNSGTVYLVGAGPGDPDLITVAGLNLLRRADVVVHDRLIPDKLLAEARPDAERINVGKTPGVSSPSQNEINELLIERARRGHMVVRLKGGDPLVFGRGGEELVACAEAGVPCVVIPGVSSALAAPAAAGIPVTHRGIARSMAVITAQSMGDSDEDAAPACTTDLDFGSLGSMDTLVILMGRANLREIAERLIESGKPANTPAACIASATTTAQRTVFAELAAIADAADRAGLRSPVVTIIGPTVLIGAALSRA